MNQILSVEMKKDKNKKSSKGPIAIKKIIIFFCIILLIFGLVIGGKSIYSIVSNGGIGISKSEDKPNVTTEKQGDKLVIAVTHTKAIEKLSYNWNSGKVFEVNGDNQKSIQQTIDIPAGNNVLNIIVTDVNGKQTAYTKEFVADQSEPQISLELIGTKIKITAKDNDRLSLITYRWDEEEEKQIEIPADSSAQVEQEIEIPTGQHTLTVVVVNAQNKQVTKTQEVKGIVKPKVTIEVDKDDPSYIVITAIDEVSLMKEIQVTINGQTYKGSETQENGTKIQYKIQVQPGENSITLKGINNDNVEEQITASYPYNP